MRRLKIRVPFEVFWLCVALWLVPIVAPLEAPAYWLQLARWLSEPLRWFGQ